MSEEDPVSDPLFKLISEGQIDAASLIDAAVAMRMGPSLVPMTPRHAVKKYLKLRDFKGETRKTIASALLTFFVDWCEQVAGIESMHTLTGADLAEYRVWRREVAPIKVEKLRIKTEKTQQQIIRKFIEYCESWNAVHPKLHETVIIPRVTIRQEVRDTVLDSKTAKEILERLYPREFGSNDFMVWLLHKSFGPRLGDIYTLDRTDFRRNEHGPYLNLEHRPETGTPLKNAEDSERTLSITETEAALIEEHIENERLDRTDEFGREPLLTTKNGRLAKGTMRTMMYAWTRPCKFGRKCPYGYDPEECRAAQRKSLAHECPDSLSSHPVRKGYITQMLKSGIPIEIISERCDVSVMTLRRHYDFRTKEEKMRARQIALLLARKEVAPYGE